MSYTQYVTGGLTSFCIPLFQFRIVNYYISHYFKGPHEVQASVGKGLNRGVGTSNPSSDCIAQPSG